MANNELQYELIDRCLQCPICGDIVCNAGKAVKRLEYLSKEKNYDVQKCKVVVMAGCYCLLQLSIVRSMQVVNWAIEAFGAIENVPPPDGDYLSIEQIMTNMKTVEEFKSNIVETVNDLTGGKVLFTEDQWYDEFGWLGEAIDELPSLPVR